MASRETPPILLYKLLEMGHLGSQRSLPVLGDAETGFSSMAKKLRPAAGHRPKGGQAGRATDLPATPWWTKRDVLREITLLTGYKPVAFVAIDDIYTALRFKRA
ncbi:MAG: hypothetical protein ACREOY_05355 [Candidatus Dormibacteraceae bacterium]